MLVAALARKVQGPADMRNAAAAAAKSLQSCPTLCDPIDGSPPGSAVPGILQAGTLEWVAISFSNAWKWKVKVKSLSHARLFATPWTAAYQAHLSMGFSRQEYWSGLPLPFLTWGLLNFYLRPESEVQGNQGILHMWLWVFGVGVYSNCGLHFNCLLTTGYLQEADIRVPGIVNCIWGNSLMECKK